MRKKLFSLTLIVGLARRNVFKAWTQRLKSGFWHRPSPTSILLYWSNSEVDLLWSISCCVIHVFLGFMFQTDGWTFSFRIFLEKATFLVPSSWTITLPQLCLKPDRTWPMFLKKKNLFLTHYRLISISFQRS